MNKTNDVCPDCGEVKTAKLLSTGKKICKTCDFKILGNIKIRKPQ